MKKLKWILLVMLALQLVTNIKAGNTVALRKNKTAVVVMAQPAGEPVTLIEQFFFPHGI